MRAHRSNRPRTSAVVASLAMAGATVVGAGAAEVASATPAYAAAPPTAENFARLRQCESRNNYWANTGNGFYGAYQFSASTWRALGYSGTPNQFPWWAQDDAAARLQAQRGWSPWPGCARALRLR
jgi:hypothetical protein